MTAIRRDAKYDLQARIFNAVQTEIEKENIYRSCMNCINFREHQGEICGLVMKRPPAKIIVNSCEHWEDRDSIPF